MLTSKQRAYLKSLANSIDTILIVGKGGVSDETINQARDAIKARELIKGKVLETNDDSALKVANDVAKAIKADVVQVIGSKFILYKRNDKDPKIVLPKKGGKNN